MRRWEIRCSHIATAVVSLSGIAYFWMKYLIDNDDPFSVVNHPWQPVVLTLHIVAAPVLVFLAGVILRSHVLRKVESNARENRISGMSSTVTLPIMIMSGYLLQTVSSPLLSRAVLVLHLASSAMFVVVYVAHQVVALRLRTSFVRQARRSASRRQVA